MANLEQGALSVETTDLMTKAIQDAMNRIQEVAPTQNLVDKISSEEWLLWDASDELSLVADLDGDCEFDDLSQQAA